MPRLPDFEAWAIFAKVAEQGSFTLAAEELGLDRSTVSKTITRLEARMRTTLLHRTTRKNSLTESGRQALDRALRILADGSAIEADILEEADVPRGRIRFASTTGFGLEALAPLLPLFMLTYPEVEIELCLTEDKIDIVADGFDLVVQIGQGLDSSLRTSRLFSFRRPLVAAPALLHRSGTPVHPSDLARYPAIVATHVPGGSEWEFVKSGEPPFTMQACGPFRVNNVNAVVPAAVAGLGIAIIPEFFISSQLASGELVEILPEWITQSAPVCLVTPPGRARPARVRVLIEFMRRHFASQPWAHGIER